jgi:hypothetical protein
MLGVDVAAGPWQGAAAGEDAPHISARLAQRELALSRECRRAVEHASRIDAAWFRRHRDRAHRLRAVVAHEHPGITFPAVAARLTLVRQIRPGLRMRLPIWTTRPVCCCEDCCAALWDANAPAMARSIALVVATVSLKAGTRL